MFKVTLISQIDLSNLATVFNLMFQVNIGKPCSLIIYPQKGFIPKR